jgi:hypothetical protein
LEHALVVPILVYLLKTLAFNDEIIFDKLKKRIKFIQQSQSSKLLLDLASIVNFYFGPPVGINGHISILC